MVGTRNIAFPRLNAFSYWLYLFGGCFLWIAFLFQEGPDVGWFAYVPLSGPQYSPTKQRRRLGADDHLHGGRGAGGRGRNHRHGVQAARAGNDARPDPDVRLVDAGHVVPGRVRDARDDGRLHAR